MIVTDESYTYSCTTCPKTGRPCAAGVRLAQQLARAMAAGGRMLSEDFEMTGHGRLEGCEPDGCGVVYSLCNREISVFCGIKEDTDASRLRAFSRAFLGHGPIPGGPYPRAMIVAARRAPADLHTGV